MAISFTTAILSDNRGTNTYTSPITSAATVSSVATGSSIILVVLHYQNAVPTSVTDSAGNTYTLDLSVADGYGTNCSIWSVHNCIALPSGGTFSATFGATVTWFAIVAGAWTGLAASSTRDVTATATGPGGGTSASSSATAATSQADELVIGAGCVYNNATDYTWTVGSGYISVSTAYNSGTGIYSIFMEYKIVAATGVQTATATSPSPPNVGTSNGLGCVTYKAAGAATVAPQRTLVGVGV